MASLLLRDGGWQCNHPYPSSTSATCPTCPCTNPASARQLKTRPLQTCLVRPQALGQREPLKPVMPLAAYSTTSLPSPLPPCILPSTNMQRFPQALGKRGKLKPFVSTLAPSMLPLPVPLLPLLNPLVDLPCRPQTSARSLSLWRLIATLPAAFSFPLLPKSILNLPRPPHRPRASARSSSLWHPYTRMQPCPCLTSWPPSASMRRSGKCGEHKT